MACKQISPRQFSLMENGVCLIDPNEPVNNYALFTEVGAGQTASSRRPLRVGGAAVGGPFHCNPLICFLCWWFAHSGEMCVFAASPQHGRQTVVPSGA